MSESRCRFLFSLVVQRRNRELVDAAAWPDIPTCDNAPGVIVAARGQEEETNHTPRAALAARRPPCV